MIDNYESIDESLSEEQTARADTPPPPCKFTTGCAGTGKTYNAVKAVRDDPSSGILSSTTGISAVNLGAITINSLLKYSDVKVMRDHFLTGALQRAIHPLARQHRNLIIDEISMYGGDALDLLYRAVEEANRYVDVPSPMGIHIIGDFCLARGTKVMMADGSPRSVEDVVIGDLLMGRDSTPRRVLGLSRGFGNLYKVHQTNGDDYVVSSKHLLALIRGNDGLRTEAWGLRYPGTNSVTLVSAEEMAKRSRKFRECFVGYKAGVINFQNSDVRIDPYYLGLWLGDGDHDGPRITTADAEVLEFCNKYAKARGMGTSVHVWDRTKAVRIRITNGRKAGHVNPLWKDFVGYGLARNKHIPREYMYNSVHKRLELLAGLLDSDGSWTGNRFSITLTNKLLIEQVKQLADQLGFRTSISVAQHGSWRVGIGGDTWRIPTKIARKKSKPRDLKRSRMTSVLTVTQVEEGEFCGFELDGDSMFLLADGTVTHNCQLPPVKAPWVFTASCWERFEENTETLTKVWRQDGGLFLDALNLVRRGDGAHGAELLAAAGARFETALDTEFDGTTILPRNDQVGRFNAMALDRMPSQKFKVTSRRWGQQRSEWGQSLRTKEWGIPPEVEFKLGAYVMLLANAPDFSYVNGDCGWVDSYSPSTSWNDPSGDVLTIKLVRTGKLISLSPLVRGVEHSDKPHDWPNHPTRVPASEDDGGWLPRPHYRTRVKRYVTGQVEYFPLRLAYATSVHKSQSLTLDKVQVDFRNHFFSQPAMLYVALSRCRSLGGLRLVGQRETFAKHCNFDERIREWL